jgi:hypothetical protein
MNQSPTREQWINQRVYDLLIDDDSVPDIIDEIMVHDGLASHGLRAHLKGWLFGDTVAIREQSANQATNIVGAFAFLRAEREYDRRPLVP